MGTYETYSKRKKKLEKAGSPDPLTYDDLPKAFRVQVVHIWNDAIGQSASQWLSTTPTAPRSSKLWNEIHKIMAKEQGVFELAPGGNAQKEVRRLSARM